MDEDGHKKRQSKEIFFGGWNSGINTFSLYLSARSIQAGKKNSAMLYTIDINQENKNSHLVKLLLENQKLVRLKKLKEKATKPNKLMEELEKGLLEVKLMSEGKKPKRKLKKLLNGK